MNSLRVSPLSPHTTLEDLRDRLSSTKDLEELRVLEQADGGAAPLQKPRLLEHRPSPAAPEIPAQFGLSEAYPNPFKPSTCIGLALPVGAHIRFVVSDLLGRVVKEVATGYFEAGYHNIMWDSRSAGNLPVSSGLYYAHLMITDGFGKPLYSKTNKLLLMK